MNDSIISKPQSGSVVYCCLSSKRHLEMDGFGKTWASSDISVPEGILPGLQLPLQKGTAQPSVECRICWARAASWIARGLWDGSRHRWDNRVLCLLAWRSSALIREVRRTKLALGICCQCAWISGSPSGLLLATIFPHYFSPGRKHMHF